LRLAKAANERADASGIGGYKDDSRRGYDASMADLIEPLDDGQILDMASYLARLDGSPGWARSRALDIGTGRLDCA
jgi:hypothetical protein